MKKVRIIAFVLALAMLFCLAACGKKNDAGKKDQSHVVGRGILEGGPVSRQIQGPDQDHASPEGPHKGPGNAFLSHLEHVGGIGLDALEGRNDGVERRSSPAS